MTPHPRIYLVEVCSDDDCPNHGEYEEKGWDDSGLHPRYPYCYLADKKLDSNVQDIPDWCPLPIHSTAPSASEQEIRESARDKVLEYLDEWLNSDDHLSLYKWEVREKIRELRLQRGKQE